MATMMTLLMPSGSDSKPLKSALEQRNISYQTPEHSHQQLADMATSILAELEADNPIWSESPDIRSSQEQISRFSNLFTDSEGYLLDHEEIHLACEGIDIDLDSFLQEGDRTPGTTTTGNEQSLDRLGSDKWQNPYEVDVPVLKEVELPSANFVSNAVAVHDCHRQPMYDGISKALVPQPSLEATFLCAEESLEAYDLDGVECLPMTGNQDLCYNLDAPSAQDKSARESVPHSSQLDPNVFLTACAEGAAADHPSHQQSGGVSSLFYFHPESYTSAPNASAPAADGAAVAGATERSSEDECFLFSSLMADEYVSPAQDDETMGTSSDPRALELGSQEYNATSQEQETGVGEDEEMQCLTETEHPRPSRITGKRSKSAGSGGNSAPSPTESGRHPPSDDLSELDRIRMCFDMPIQEASKLLGIGVTVLKRKCRQYNIPRWPYRKLKSLQNLYQSMSNLECQHMDHGGIDINNIRETKLKLFVERESMRWDPAIGLNKETKKLRQSNFKYEYKVRREYPSSRSGNSASETAGDGNLGENSASHNGPRPPSSISAGKQIDCGANHGNAHVDSDDSTAVSGVTCPDPASDPAHQQMIVRHTPAGDGALPDIQ